MAETSFYVQGATKSEPIQQIEHLLHGLEGIERVLIDTEDGEVKVEYMVKKFPKKG